MTVGVEHVHEREIAGIRTVYFERGSGPALVLLHGMFGDCGDWETVLEPLAETYRVIAPDLPGFGASAKPDVSYDAEFFLDWLDALFESLHVRKAVLVGNSFGGEIAILFALAHPEKVARLILVSSGGLRFYTENERNLIVEKFSVPNLKALTPAAHEFLFQTVFSQKGTAWRRYLEKQNAKLLRPDFAQYATALHRCMRLAFSLYFDQKLTRLRMPVLLIWGDGDVVFPIALAQRALKRIRNGELVLLEGGGHAPQLENPEAFVRAVERATQSPVGMAGLAASAPPSH